MSVFLLAEIETIHDPDSYREYTEKVEPIINKYGGEYIIRSDFLTSVTGKCHTERVILIRFESTEKLKACFNSEEYISIKHLRENATESRSMIIEE